MTTTVYLITCLPNGRKYIGITDRGIKRRWTGHAAMAKHADGRKGPLRSAIQKYGRDAFTIVPLYEADSRKEALMVEKGLIAAYGTFFPNGMNLTSGGEGVSGSKNPPSPATLAKRSAALRGRNINPEQIEVMRKTNTGRKRPPEEVEKRRRSRFGRRKHIVWQPGIRQWEVVFEKDGVIHRVPAGTDIEIAVTIRDDLRSQLGGMGKALRYRQKTEPHQDIDESQG